MADDPMLQFFVHDPYAPPEVREMNQHFAGLAKRLVDTLPKNPERTVCLRKLMEAKDCANRARAFKNEG
jgi:hypothetical protein